MKHCIICIIATFLVLVAIDSALNHRRKQTTSTPAPVQVKAPSFIPPTAEEAYRLQDDCSRRGAAILRDNVIGSALAQEQVSRYNATTNRCYVRLDVHALRLDEWQKYDTSFNLYDGQTGEMLAYIRITPAPTRRSFLGFNCNDMSESDGFSCVTEKIAACMNGKECDTQ
jgi:hypothetical protein